MERDRRLDSLDQTLLRILSAHGDLTPLLVWHHLGRNDTARQGVSEREIRRRLESLEAGGYVERVVTQERETAEAPAIYRIRTEPRR
jgi:DNA-binding Lrp family transcriptional regulator